MFFIPSVKNHADKRANARPSQPTWSSQSFRFHINVLGVSLGTVGPGTKMMETIAMMQIGTTAQRMSSKKEGTVSCSVKGRLFSSRR